MTDRQIHDLLERAVRDHSPVTVDPARAVLTRAGRERRRSIALTVAATMVVVLGGGGLLTIVDTQTSGEGTPAGPGEQVTVTEYVDPAEERALREAAQAAERAVAEAAERAAAEAEMSWRPGIVIATPVGWTEFPYPANPVGPDAPDCQTNPNVVYRATMGTGGAGRPCLGTPAIPYIWTPSREQLPSLTRPLTQQLSSDGVPIWVQDSTDGTGNPVVDIHRPGSGLLVRAAGVPLDDLLSYLIVPETTPAPLTLSARPPGDESELVEGFVTLFRAGEAVPVAGQPDLQQLDQALRKLPATGDCVPSGEQWRIDVDLGGMRVNHIVVDDLGGCTTVLSSAGGFGQATPELVALLERLAAG